VPTVTGGHGAAAKGSGGNKRAKGNAKGGAKGGESAAEQMDFPQHKLSILAPQMIKVGRCRLPVSKPVLKVHMVSTLEATL
jgi:hypothetical protein